MLEFTDVKKYYGSFLALDIPSLQIDVGVWWLRGDNGSGKTTFLKMIAGLHPFDGSVVLQKTLQLKKNRRSFVRIVNYAEAEPLYPSFLTASDLIELYCATKAGSKQQALQMLQSLQIADAYNQQLGTYSSGMLKKLSLTLAFIGQPQLILLDEPLITIDVNAVENICRLIREHAQKGVSFIISSHQPVTPDLLQFTGILQTTQRTVQPAL